MSPIAPAARLGVRVEPALDVDDRGEERRVEVVVRGVPADDVLVLERVARAEVPVRLLLDDPRGRTGEDQNGQAARIRSRMRSLSGAVGAPSYNL